MKFLQLFLAVVTLGSLCACAMAPAVPEPDLRTTALPAAAAEYVTTRHSRGDRGASEATQWRLWRSTDRVTTENLSARTSEVWQRDGSALFHQQLYHEDRRGIEFQPGDLQLLSAGEPSWPKQCLALDPQLLTQLTLDKQGWTGGHDSYPYRRYTGQIEGFGWTVILRIDLMVPALVERKRPGFVERTELKAAYPLVSAPWQPTGSDDYELIDFADLGDREDDPFVVKVERSLGHSHAH